MRHVLRLLAASGLLSTLFPPTVAAAPPLRLSESETRLRAVLRGWIPEPTIMTAQGTVFREAPRVEGELSAKKRMIRLVAGVFLAAAVLAPGSAALAAKSEHIVSETLHFACDLLQSGDAAAFLSGSMSEAGGSADLPVWIAPDDVITDDPTWLTSGSTIDLAADRGSLSGRIDLIDRRTGESVGSAAIRAAFTPAGPALINERRLEGTNRQERVVESIQPLAVSGMVTLPGGSVLSLDEGCQATDMSSEMFRNNPSSTVSSSDTISLFCEWHLDGGVYLALLGDAVNSSKFMDVAVVTPDGSFPGGDEDPTLTSSRIEGSFVLVAAGQGFAATGGTATAAADVSVASRVSWTERDGNTRLRVTVEQLTVRGTLNVQLDNGSSWTVAMDSSGCGMTHTVSKLIQGGNGG